MIILSSTDFITNLNNTLDNIGLQGDFGKLFIAIIVLIVVAVTLAYYKIPIIINLMLLVIGILTFVAFGWFPIWVPIVLLALLIGYLYIISNLGGASA